MSYERLFRPNPLLRCLGGVLLIASFSTLAREYRFSPSSLEGDMLAQQDIDLSLFSKSNAQLPGTYGRCDLISHDDPEPGYPPYAAK